MAKGDLITTTDALVINYIGIGIAALGIIGLLCLCGPILYRYTQCPKLVRRQLDPLPTRLLYSAACFSGIFSIFWMISCSALASHQKACSVSMWFIITTIHLMNGLLLSILLHCGLLLSSKNAELSARAVKYHLCLVLIASLCFSCVGVSSGRFGYLEDQQTCWIIPAAHRESVSAYRLEVALLYGPVFACLLLEVVGACYIYYVLHQLRITTAIEARAKTLMKRLCLSPCLLGFHCLMVIGGDLPITYHTRAGQLTSYLLNYMGFSSYGIVTCLCTIFINPTYMCIVTPYSERRAHDVEHGMAEVVKVTTPEIKDPTGEEVQEETFMEVDSAHWIATGTVNSALPFLKSDQHVCMPDGDCCIHKV